MNAHLPLAIAALEDLRDDIHFQATQEFFQSHFVSYGNLCRDEATVLSAIQLIQRLSLASPLPPAMHGDTAVAS